MVPNIIQSMFYFKIIKVFCAEDLSRQKSELHDSVFDILVLVGRIASFGVLINLFQFWFSEYACLHEALAKYIEVIECFFV
jgi:hypothetical protein